MKFIGRLLKFVIQSFIQPFITNPNKIITDRPFIGKTHALIWAVKKSCDANFYITYVDLVFASLITEATLNYTLEEGPDKGKSVAYFLARSGEGRALLAHNNFALGSKISAETLNHIIEEGYHDEGYSVAYWLATFPTGRAMLYWLKILKHNNYQLGSKISAETLNHIIKKGEQKGKSVAY